MDEGNKISSGASWLSFVPKGMADFEELSIVDNSAVIGFDKCAPINMQMPESLTIGIKLKERELLDLLEEEWGRATMKREDAIRELSFIIEGEPRINRPKNIKYPNKKRAKRIWNKWRNRFGVTPSRRTVIPKAIVSVKPAFRNNQTYYDIEAVVEKGDLK